MTGNPVKFLRTPAEQFSSPPRFGEHTVEVLRTLLDCGPERIVRLAGAGAFGPPGMSFVQTAVAREG